QQVGTPREMYDKPANTFVAGFIGSPAMNLGTFKVHDGVAHLGDAHIPLPRATADALTADDGGQITLGFRPESLDVVAEGTDGAFAINVNLVEELGSDAYVYGELASTEEAENIRSGAGESQLVVRVNHRTPPMQGDRVWVQFREVEQYMCSAGAGERLPDQARYPPPRGPEDVFPRGRCSARPARCPSARPGAFRGFICQTGNMATPLQITAVSPDPA